MTALPGRFKRSVWVRTAIPAATGVVQDAGGPARPSISTRQRRQAPNASTMSVAHSFGIFVPISMAARMIYVCPGAVSAGLSELRMRGLSSLQRGHPHPNAPTTYVRVTVLRQPRGGGFPHL